MKRLYPPDSVTFWMTWIIGIYVGACLVTVAFNVADIKKDVQEIKEAVTTKETPNAKHD